MPDPLPPPNSDRSDDAAPGWDAIDAACAAIYVDQVPRHVGYTPPAALSANLDGCSAYDAGDHWHYVSYGLSELYEPGPNDDPAYSGWGFELTLRLAKALAEVNAPGWPFTMINELAKQVNTNRMLLEPGHWIDLGAPATGYPDLPDAPNTNCTVFAVDDDPMLGTISTPHGAVTFLQLVPVTAADKQRMVAGSTASVLAGLRGESRLLIFRP